MNKLSRLAVAVGTFLPNIALAHEDLDHASQSIWQQFFNFEHALIFGLPTLIAVSLLYKNKSKLNSYLTKIKVKK